MLSNSLASAMQQRTSMFLLLCLALLLMAFMPLARRMEQRATIKFLQRSGKKPMDIWRSLKDVYGAESLSKTQVWEWFNQFRDSNITTPTKDLPRAGRPRRRLQYRGQVQAILQQDHHQTLDQLSTKTGISRSSVHRLLKTDLKMSKVSPKFVPRILTAAQKQHRIDLCQQNLASLRADKNLLEKVITTDESWFAVFDPETKVNSLEWRVKGETRPQKAIWNRATCKTMAILFFDTLGVIHLEFLPRGQTIDSDFWIEVVKRLKESIRRKRPIMWKGGFDSQTDRDFILHMDNAPVHVSVPSLAFYGECDVNLLPHPAYSPDLAPCDFWAFPSVKSKLRGRRFRNIEELQTKIRNILRRTPKEEFEQALYDMPVRWSKCVSAAGEYFEGGSYCYNPEDLPHNTSSESSPDTDSDNQ